MSGKRARVRQARKYAKAKADPVLWEKWKEKRRIDAIGHYHRYKHDPVWLAEKRARDAAAMERLWVRRNPGKEKGKHRTAEEMAVVEAAKQAARAAKAEGVKRWHHCQILHCKLCKAPFMRNELPKGYLCRDCRKIKRKAYRKRHPHAAKASKARRRALERGADGSFTQKDWLHVLAIHGNKCQICDSTENLTCDHKIPLSLGGSNDWTNLQPLCHLCNSTKCATITGAVQSFIPGVKLTYALTP